MTKLTFGETQPKFGSQHSCNSGVDELDINGASLYLSCINHQLVAITSVEHESLTRKCMNLRGINEPK